MAKRLIRTQKSHVPTQNLHLNLMLEPTSTSIMSPDGAH
jgi:hypothetical protein